ncbi:MAG: hypothetical protein AB7Q37_16610 [Pyrinomonadaceae bacterium]
MKSYLILILVTPLFLFFAETVVACSCMISSPCQMNARADAIFIGKINNVEPDRGSARHTVEIERNFEGMDGRRVVDIITDQSSSCAFSMQQGERYLIFANVNEESGRIFAWYCSGTKPLKEASKEMAYLESIKDTPTDKGVLNGKVLEYDARYKVEMEPFKPKEIDQVFLEAASGKISQVPIGPDGEFVFRDLRGGRYKVFVDAPERLVSTDEIDSEFVSEKGSRRVGGKVKVLGSGCSSSRYFTFYVNGVISGRVLSADGRPMKRFPVTSLRYEDGDDMPEKLDRVWTNDEGVYVFKGLPPARYLIGFEIGNSLYIESPFSGYMPVFYPNVLDRKRAKHVELGYNQILPQRDIVLKPELAKRKIFGRVIRANGQPAINADTVFHVRRRAAADRIEGGYEMNLDLDGRFELEIFEQTEYWILSRLFDSNDLETRKIVQSSKCYKVSDLPAAGSTSVEIVLKPGSRNCDIRKLD